MAFNCPLKAPSNEATRLHFDAIALPGLPPTNTSTWTNPLRVDPPGTVGANLYLVDGKLRAGQNPEPGWRLVAFSGAVIDGGEGPPPEGGGDPVVQLSNQIITRSTGSPSAGQSKAGYRIHSSGVAQKLLGTTTVTTLETWLLSGAAGDYHFRATPLSGDALQGDATGTWIAATDSPEWYLDCTPVPDLLTCQFLIEASDDGGTSVIESATIVLESELF